MGKNRSRIHQKQNIQHSEMNRLKQYEDQKKQLLSYNQIIKHTCLDLVIKTGF